MKFLTWGLLYIITVPFKSFFAVKTNAFWPTCGPAMNVIPSPSLKLRQRSWIRTARILSLLLSSATLVVKSLFNCAICTGQLFPDMEARSPMNKLPLRRASRRSCTILAIARCISVSCCSHDSTIYFNLPVLGTSISRESLSQLNIASSRRC